PKIILLGISFDYPLTLFNLEVLRSRREIERCLKRSASEGDVWSLLNRGPDSLINRINDIRSESGEAFGPSRSPWALLAQVIVLWILGPLRFFSLPFPIFGFGPSHRSR